MGSHLSSRNCGGNIDSDQPLSAERDCFSFHFTGMNMELMVNNFFYDYSYPGRKAKQPCLVSRIKFWSSVLPVERFPGALRRCLCWDPGNGRPDSAHPALLVVPSRPPVHFVEAKPRSGLGQLSVRPGGVGLYLYHLHHCLSFKIKAIEI